MQVSRARRHTSRSKHGYRRRQCRQPQATSWRFCTLISAFGRKGDVTAESPPAECCVSATDFWHAPDGRDRHARAGVPSPLFRFRPIRRRLYSTSPGPFSRCRHAGHGARRPDRRRCRAANRPGRGNHKGALRRSVYSPRSASRNRVIACSTSGPRTVSFMVGSPEIRGEALAGHSLPVCISRWIIPPRPGIYLRKIRARSGIGGEEPRAATDAGRGTRRSSPLVKLHDVTIYWETTELGPSMTTRNHQRRDRFGSLIAQVARQWRRAVDLHLRQFGLTEATWLPLIHLARAPEPMRQKDLAASLVLDGSSVVRLLDQLRSRRSHRTAARKPATAAPRSSPSPSRGRAYCRSGRGCLPRRPRRDAGRVCPTPTSKAPRGCWIWSASNLAKAAGRMSHNRRPQDLTRR